MNKVVGVGAAVAVASVLAVGGVIASEDTAQPHTNPDLPGLEWWYVTFVYPDGTEDTKTALNYTGGESAYLEQISNDFKLREGQYPDPPDGYEWDHPLDYRYTEDTTVHAIPLE